MGFGKTDSAVVAEKVCDVVAYVASQERLYAAFCGTIPSKLNGNSYPVAFSGTEPVARVRPSKLTVTLSKV